MHQVATSYGQRPSELVGLHPEQVGGWLCYLFDRQVWQFGHAVDNEVEAERHKPNGKPQRRFEELMSGKRDPGKKRYGNAAQLIALLGNAASVKRVP